MNQVENFLAGIDVEKATLVHFFRAHIFRNHPELTERLSYGLPFIYGKKGICYFNVKKTGVDVGFMYGKRLPQHSNLIATDRKQVRSLFFKTDEDINVEVFNLVFESALLLDAQWK